MESTAKDKGLYIASAILVMFTPVHTIHTETNNSAYLHVWLISTITVAMAPVAILCYFFCENPNLQRWFS